MTQTDLNRAVAEATGESVDRIARLGFNFTAAPTPIPWWRLATTLKSLKQLQTIDA